MAKKVVLIDLIFVRFQELYEARYHRRPPTLVDGVVMSILTGEVQMLTEEPEFSPLREIAPLLRLARQGVSE